MRFNGIDKRAVWLYYVEDSGQTVFDWKVGEGFKQAIGGLNSFKHTDFLVVRRIIFLFRMFLAAGLFKMMS